MAWTLAFSITQDTNAANFTLVDGSTGSDPAVTQRRIVLTLSDGTNLGGSYIDFPFSEGASKLVAGLLIVDESISITLQYLNVSGTVLYSLSKTYCFKENDEQFIYWQVQNIAANRSILQDTNFVSNLMRLRVFVDSANNAVVTGNDIGSSQMCLDLAQEMINNPTTYF